MATRTVTTSPGPRWAPVDHAALPPRVVVSDGGGLWLTWYGSGERTAEPCAACGNTIDNLLVYHNEGTSYPNGNAWDERELRCGACGAYTCVAEHREG